MKQVGQPVSRVIRPFELRDKETMRNTTETGTKSYMNSSGHSLRGLTGCFKINTILLTSLFNSEPFVPSYCLST